MYLKNNAHSYTNALYILAKEDNQLQNIYHQINFLDKAIKENQEFLLFLNDFRVKNSQKTSFIDYILVKYHPYVINLLKILIDKRKTYFLPKITQQFLKLAHKELNTKHGIIYTTIALTNNKIKEICNKISKKYGFVCTLENKIDPNLIAGFKIVIDSLVIENNIDSILRDHKEMLS